MGTKRPGRRPDQSTGRVILERIKGTSGDGFRYAVFVVH